MAKGQRVQIIGADAPVPVDIGAASVTVTTGDIELGAVEIKNGADDTRAVVGTAPPAAGDPGLVVRQVRTGTITDRSGTIAAGGVAQNAAAVNATRRYLFVMNPAAETEVLGLNFTTAAIVTGQPSILLAPGDSFAMEGQFVSTEAISVNAATTGHKFVCKEG